MFESSTDAADAREKIARRAAAKAEKAGLKEAEVNRAGLMTEGWVVRVRINKL